jgi:hypothetical protein
MDEPLERVQTTDTKESGPPTIDIRSSLVELLNNEIDFIVQREQRPGWTIWAVLASLGTLVWLLISQIELASGPLKAVPGFFIAISIFLGGLDVVSLSLSSSTPLKDSIRARLQTYFDEDRPSLMFELLRRVTLLLLVFNYTALVSKVWVVLTAIYLLSPFLFMILSVRLSYLKLPRQAYSPQGELCFSLLLLVFSLGLLFSAWEFFSSTLESVERIGLSDYRISALLVATVFLLHRLIIQTKPPPLLSTLVELRRSIVFGTIEAKEAIFRADIALAGMRVASVLQLDVQKILKLFGELDIEAAEMSKRYEKVASILPQVDSPLTRELVSNALELMKGSNEKFEVMGNLIDEIIRLQDLFSSKYQALEMIFSKASPDVESLPSKIDSAIKSAQERSDELVVKQQPLLEWAKAFKGAPASRGENV